MMTYIKSILLTAAFALLTLTAYSGTPQTLLWKVSGNGLQAPSYIFGTIHALCPEDLQLTDAVQKSLASSAQLSLEVDMDAPNFMAELMKYAVLPEGKKLSSYFSKEEYMLLSNYVASTLKLDLKLFESMKPFMLQSLLLSQLTDCEAVSYEQRLMDVAHEQGKEVIGVESIKEQLAAMDKLPQQMQADMVIKTVKDLPAAKASYKQMVKLYLMQDLDGLTSITKEDMRPEEYSLYEEAFLVERNKRWIPAIEREAKAKATFFAVGAGHLGGDNGILELLRKRGYTITPVVD